METLFSASEGVCFLDTHELGFFYEFSALIFRIQTSVCKGKLSLLALSVSVSLLCLSLTFYFRSVSLFLSVSLVSVSDSLGNCWRNDCVYMWSPEENPGQLSLSFLHHILLRQGLPLNLELNWQPANQGSSFLCPPHRWDHRCRCSHTQLALHCLRF